MRMKWPDPGTLQKCTVSDIPVGTKVDGMGPIGVRMSAIRTKNGFKTDNGCPSSEFVPCFVEMSDYVYEVVR